MPNPDQKTSPTPQDTRNGAAKKAPSSADAFAQQESGASGGPPPTSDELSGRTPDQSASHSTDARRQRDPQTTPRDTASQHQVQGSADADADHETGDQSEGVAKRMD